MRPSPLKQSGSLAIESSKLSEQLNLAMISDYRRISANVDCLRARGVNRVSATSALILVGHPKKTFKPERGQDRQRTSFGQSRNGLEVSACLSVKTQPFEGWTGVEITRGRPCGVTNRIAPREPRRATSSFGKTQDDVCPILANSHHVMACHWRFRTTQRPAFPKSADYVEKVLFR